MNFRNRNNNSHGLRVIKTARDKRSINEAARIGFRPLIKMVEPSNAIRSKYAVFQNKTTGEIEVITDFRNEDDFERNNEFEKVIGWTFYYPNHFKSPIAAYLIPRDIVVGEKVFIEDLIEDFVASSWNQGDTFRLQSCEAIWSGSELEIQYDPKDNRSEFIG